MKKEFSSRVKKMKRRMEH